MSLYSTPLTRAIELTSREKRSDGCRRSPPPPSRAHSPRAGAAGGLGRTPLPPLRDQRCQGVRRRKRRVPGELLNAFSSANQHSSFFNTDWHIGDTQRRLVCNCMVSTAGAVQVPMCNTGHLCSVPHCFT
ncbi:uncharacterized protein VSU04_008195 [Chlamydotis macqueenii]